MATELEDEIKRLIVSALNFENLKPEDIATDEPLFNVGLGLDSIDGLELEIVLRKTYQLKIKSATEGLREHFTSVATLASFVAANREEA